jgi:hypothetical protein
MHSQRPLNLLKLNNAAALIPHANAAEFSSRSSSSGKCGDEAFCADE